MLLGFNEEFLKEKNAYITASAIVSQPGAWKELFKYFIKNKEDFKRFLDPIFQTKNVKIILTGAGSSAFVGDCSAGYLRRALDLDVESVDSTDIAAAPENYFLKDRPTLLISYSKSGNSPESLAVIQEAQQLINDIYFLNITCNKEGQLAKMKISQERSMSMVLPEETNDSAYAATVSFTTMLLTNLLLPYLVDKKCGADDIMQILVNESKRILDEDCDKIKNIAEESYDRLHFLGSGSLKGCAREAALKLLELTQGTVNATYSSFLGLRHGQKFVINDKTILGCFVSNNAYTQKYDLDLVDEISHNKMYKGKILLFEPKALGAEGADYVISLENEDIDNLDEAFLTLLYALYAQMLGLFKSIKLGIKSDNLDPAFSIKEQAYGVVEKFKIYNL